MRHLRWVQRKTVVYLYGGSHVCSIFKSYTDISWFIREMPFKNENYLPAWWGALNFIANTVSDRKMTYYMKSISSTTPQKKKNLDPSLQLLIANETGITLTVNEKKIKKCQPGKMYLRDLSCFKDHHHHPVIRNGSGRLKGVSQPSAFVGVFCQHGKCGQDILSPLWRCWSAGIVLGWES